MEATTLNYLYEYVLSGSEAHLLELRKNTSMNHGLNVNVSFDESCSNEKIRLRLQLQICVNLHIQCTLQIMSGFTIPVYVNKCM